MPLDNEKPDVALVAYDTLGDGLIYLMMAENLSLNGFEVTYYGKQTADLREWLPQFRVERYSTEQDLDSELGRHDLVLYSPPTSVRQSRSPDEMRRLAERYVLICNSPHIPDYWSYDHTERIKRDLPPEKARKLLGLAGCGARIRHRQFGRETVVEITLAFMKEKMQLESATKEVRLTVPDGLEHRRYRRRIVISPDSASPGRKDWDPGRFLALADRLAARGYDPRIVVAPANHQTWKTMPGNIYETPKFLSISELAAFLYESGAVVANDSGNGHLASFLRVPTITIHRGLKPNYAWRPGWGPGTIVCPTIAVSLFKRRLWRPFVPTAKILRAIDDYCLEQPGVVA